MHLFQRDSHPLLVKNSTPQPIPARNPGRRAVCLAAMVSLGFAAGLAGAQGVYMSKAQTLASAGRLSARDDGIEAQVLSSTPALSLNPEAFSKVREKAITNDSQELLRLAIALKAEIDQSPGAQPSADAIEKVREIEKLAKDVKKRMAVSLARYPR